MYPAPLPHEPVPRWIATSSDSSEQFTLAIKPSGNPIHHRVQDLECVER